jgi:hypothetical protein
MSKQFSFPPLPHKSVDYSYVNFLPALEKAIGELAKSYCPVCQVFVAEGEIHFSNTATWQCSRIVNISWGEPASSA